MCFLNAQTGALVNSVLCWNITLVYSEMCGRVYSVSLSEEMEQQLRQVHSSSGNGCWWLRKRANLGGNGVLDGVCSLS